MHPCHALRVFQGYGTAKTVAGIAQLIEANLRNMHVARVPTRLSDNMTKLIEHNVAF